MRRRSAAALGFLGPIALLFLASLSVQLRSAFLMPATGEAAANTGGGEYDEYADSPRWMRRREGGGGEADDEDDDEGDQGGRGVTTTMHRRCATTTTTTEDRRDRIPGRVERDAVCPWIDGVGYDENRSSSFEFASVAFCQTTTTTAVPINQSHFVKNNLRGGKNFVLAESIRLGGVAREESHFNSSSQSGDEPRRGRSRWTIAPRLRRRREIR
jgi:hypothetical protein